MIKIKNKKRNLSFNVIAMADLSFLLLTFFIISICNNSDKKGLKINLPKSSSSELSDSKIVISITCDNNFFLNQKKIDLFEIKNFFEKSQFEKNKTVIIDCDKNVSVDSLIKIADIVSTHGLQINISTDLEK